MLIEEKYFRQDKNYLLKSVQAFAKDAFLKAWSKQLLSSYNHQHNPMGLVDEFISQLENKIDKSISLLEESYDLLAAIYRYNHSDNQLEFNWDGRSHMETYHEEWKEMYQQWIRVLSQIKELQRPVIRFVTQGDGFNNDFLKASIKKAILSHFNMKLRSRKLYQLSA